MTWDNLLMQGFERMDRELTDAEMLAGHLVPAGSMFAFLAAHRAEVFPDADYADLFAAFGRPSLPATRMAAVLALQSLHDYSDRETAEAVRFDVRWKVACGLAIDDAGFDPSSLVYWRGRIARSERPHRVNEAIRLIVEQTGVLKGRRRRAVDSTILADAVATQDTVTQLISAIRRVAREVPGAAEQIAKVCTGHDYSKPGKPEVDWDHPAANDTLGSAPVNDAHAVRAAETGREIPDAAQQRQAAGAAGPDTDDAGAAGQCGAGATGSRGSDSDSGPLAWYGDSAYGTGDLRDAIENAGHQAVIKPKPLQAPVEGGFTVDDFTVGEEEGTVTCPAGHTVALSRTRIATFGALCRDCPLRKRCTTCKTGRKLVPHERDDLLRQARADWAASTGLREDYMKHRPNVERVIAQVATRRGRRLKLRYRAVASNNAWLKRRTAALNLRNLNGRGLA